MRFIHSDKQYIERTMYPINPYVNTSTIDLSTKAFVAPVGFNPDAQGLNIVTVFDAYSDVNKRYIFSVDASSSATILPTRSGRSYAYSENSGVYVTITSGTVTWTTGSNKRVVIVLDTNTGITANIPNSAVWLYVSSHVTAIDANINTTLKYIHCEELSSLTTIPDVSFNYCKLTGNLNLKDTNINYVGVYAFYAKDLITNNLIFPYTLTSFNNASFGLMGITGDLNLSMMEYGSSSFVNNTGLNGKLTLRYSFYFNNWNGTGGGLFSGCSNFTELDLPAGYSGTYLWFDFSQKWTASSLNQSIVNITSGTKILVIGATNKTRLLASYPSAETNANARGITIN